MDLPMPEPEPVTIATLPARRPGIGVPPLDDGSILCLIFAERFRRGLLRGLLCGFLL